MFTVLYARDPGSFRECPTPCGYRYCHTPDQARGVDHVHCQLAEAKLYSNGIATETNLLKRALRGGAL